MSNQRNTRRFPQVAGADSPLVTHCAPVVALRNTKAGRPFDDALARRLRDAAGEGSPEDVTNLISAMLEAGLSQAEIATQYVPHAARQMGEDWSSDTLTFSRVTIGTARLQSALHLLGNDWSPQQNTRDDTECSSVVIVVPKGSNHTLGAMILSGELRRMGLSVRLIMGASHDELRNIFKLATFEAVLISASEPEMLNSLRLSVDIIRESAAFCPPIVIGGGILDQVSDVKTQIGADFATKDPFEALQLCGLAVHPWPPATFVERRI